MSLHSWADGNYVEEQRHYVTTDAVLPDVHVLMAQRDRWRRRALAMHRQADLLRDCWRFVGDETPTGAQKRLPAAEAERDVPATPERQVLADLFELVESQDDGVVLNLASYRTLARRVRALLDWPLLKEDRPEVKQQVKE